jgi:hypothetical protein
MFLTRIISSTYLNPSQLEFEASVDVTPSKNSTVDIVSRNKNESRTHVFIHNGMWKIKIERKICRSHSSRAEHGLDSW